MLLNNRQSEIVTILANENVCSQQQLVNLLNNRGILVTQATVSRDLAMIGACKVLQNDGSYRYIVRQGKDNGISERHLWSICRKVCSVSVANNLIVVKTLSGNAEKVAKALEKFPFDDVVGMVCDSKTILIVAQDGNVAQSIALQLKNYKN